MKISSVLSLALLSAFTVDAFLIPSNLNAIARRSEDAVEQKRDTSLFNDLWRRKGGGGGGKGGGSSSSSSGSSSSSSSGGKTGSSSGGSSSGARAPNAGGATSAGSGVRPAYGGGRYYGGGATVPYTAGARSPRGLPAAAFIGVGALAFFPGLWLYGAYLYPYSHPYSFYNSSARMNQTRPVKCLCQQYSVCGCDDNDDPQYMQGLIGNGTNLNQTLVRVADVNGTDTIFVNGTLPNGTTASGGTDSSSAGMKGKAIETVGWCVIGGAVALAMAML